ncbi:MAG: RNA polymerase sigma factor [Pseudomonadales bacterium]
MTQSQTSLEVGEIPGDATEVSAGGVHSQDLELAKRVVDKDRKAVEEFFSSYFARLYRFAALRVDQPSACEDVVQEAMIKAVRYLHSYRGEAALYTWLCQICRNEISNYYRSQGRRELSLVSLDDDQNSRSTLESQSVVETNATEHLEVEQIVHLTLDGLPDRYASALEWKYLEGLSVVEIAQRFSMGVTATQSMLARARTAFRASYREFRGIEGE